MTDNQADWGQFDGTVEAGQKLQMTEEDKDKLIQKWLEAKSLLSDATVIEKSFRTDVTEALFPNAKKGTQRYISPKGYGAIKLVYGYNYRLGDPEAIDPTTGMKISAATQVEKVLDDIEALGERGKLIADRVVKWKPEISVTEYEMLAQSENDIDARAFEMLSSILTISPASPALTFEPPKAAK